MAMEIKARKEDNAGRRQLFEIMEERDRDRLTAASGARAPAWRRPASG
jgi:hypothetical protein